MDTIETLVSLPRFPLSKTLSSPTIFIDACTVRTLVWSIRKGIIETHFKDQGTSNKFNSLTPRRNQGKNQDQDLILSSKWEI